MSVILEPGAFRTSDYRKAIPDWVKVLAAISAYIMIEPMNRPLTTELADWVRGLRYDHRPPLQDRPYDTENGDFIPGQNDPLYIEAIPAKLHDERTFGRKRDAERTVTTVGSDSHNRKRVRDLSRDQAEHDLKMAAKAGDVVAMQQLVTSLEKDRRRPKRKIPSRPFPKKKAA